jgi:enamine deaminase RidA (YjgF/YER057c/UK114 family)
MDTSREVSYAALLKELDIEFEEEFRPGANYAVAVQYGSEIHVSGQLPRVRGVLAATGHVGQDVSMELARFAAQVSALRLLAILRQSLGSLSRVKQVLKLNVYVQSATGFTQQSEVADAASEVLYRVLGEVGTHARTSVGVFQLPKNGAVEIDLVAAIDV